MGNEVVTVTVKGIGDFSDIMSQVKGMQGAFNSLKLNPNLTSSFNKEFSNLQKLLDDYRKAMEKPVSSKKDLKNIEALEKAINSSFSTINKLYSELNGQTILTKVDSSQLDELRQKTQTVQKAIQDVFSNINIGSSTKGIGEIESTIEKAVSRSKTLKNSFDEVFSGLLKNGDIKQFTGGLDSIFENLTSKLKAGKLEPTINSLLNSFKSLGLIKIDMPLDSTAQKLLALKTGFETLKTAIANGVNGEELTKLVGKLDEATQAERNFLAEASKRGQDNYSKQAAGAEKLAGSIREATAAEREFKQQSFSAAQQVEQLQQSTQYFFGLRNMINLLKRGVKEAVNTVKELDAAMTQTAVVTNFSVGDMWGKLPEYIANANALGASVKDMYESATLYYQQGLQGAEVMNIASETMKMARIGGLEAADATDKMTAALRGFNMELNEASAQRVNDVYSNLAAKTASDTEELGTAMQRTASIAASAGMSFEGTAAFLAQAIETTREPAENLGTAMKTIVARFQELKKNPLEISDVEGEEVDYNKVDAALKTIGVDLKDTNGQFRDLDQVFLDISQRWNSLTQTQQRYIATTAAGSRQQSRFIAMMSNYDRTMELMSYANDSSGASNEQFGKTLDSLEAKLNKFQNAWKEFLMGIMNDSWTKGIVSGATKILDVVNSLIDTLSFGGKAKGIKSFLSLFTAFTALKMTGRVANRMIGGLGGLVDPTSSFKQGFKGAAFRQSNPAIQAKAISQPIVGALQKISGQIASIATKQGIKQQYGNFKGEKATSKEEYAQAKKDFSKLSGQKGFTMGEASKIFGSLDEKHQRSLFMNNPGTRLAMKQASLQWFNSKELSKEMTAQGKSYINAIYKGMEQGQISVDKGVKLIGQPGKWGKYFGTEAAKGYSQSFIKESLPAMKASVKASTQQAHQNAMQYLVGNPQAYGFQSKEFKDWYNNQANEAQKEVYAKYFKAGLKKGTGSHEGAKGKVSDMGRFANDIGAVGDKFTQAGYGISAFGSLLAQLGGPIGMVGTGLQSLGGIISSLGMSVSGMTSIFTLFTVGLTDATGAVVVAGSTIASVVAPLAALGAALFLAHRHFKKIKEAGEEVTKTFTEQNKEAEDNISKLKSYQGELAQLSKGVDSNGNNVSLDDSQYQRYLEIVDDIAAINPEIVEGYNAQGHAIINNNTALAETLKKQEEIQKKVFDTYTNAESLQKLINARNINKDYRNIQTQENGVSMGYGHGNEGRSTTGGIGKAIPLAGDVASIADKLRLATGTDALGNTVKIDDTMLQKYGIKSFDALMSGEEQAVKKFIKHREQIQADLSNSGIELNEGILKGFEKLEENKQAFDEAIQPVYDNLLTQVSQSPLYDSIADEFKGALQTGLKDLAAQDLSASEMSKAANNMAARFANLTTGSGKYADALKIAEDAQSKFADTLDETEYKADVQPAIDDLTRLKEEALDEGTAYGDALAEYLENQIQRISNFTKEGGANLSEALNTATDEIAAAESALDNFNEATKKDYSTASEGMKSIYDKTTETFKDSYGTEIQKHAEGMGDATFWTGAENLLSSKAIDKITANAEDGYDAAQKVSKALKDLEPMLRDGQEGFDAFTQRVLDHSDALDKLADAGVTYDKETGLLTNIPDDQWHNVAEALGISDDLLAAMISKGRQFANISFMNVEEARKSLAASDFTIKGTSAKEGEQQKLYVKEDTLRAELASAGYVRREQQDEQIEVLKGQNVDILKSAESYEKGSKELADKFNDMGVRTLPDLIQTLNDTGDFTKDEIKDYADKAGLLGSDAQYDELYTDIIEAAENPELVKQTGVLETISAQIAALAVSDNAAQGTTKKELEAANKELLGGKGVDTDAQAFAYGKKLVKDEDGNIVRDKNGNVKLENLTAGEYEETKKSMQAVADSYRETAAIAEAKAKTATGEDKKYWEDVQKSAEEGAVRANKYLQMADKARAGQAEKEQKEKEGRQKEIEARNQSSPSGLISSLLQQDMDLSLKEAIGNLDAAEIASDPQKTMALSNLYKDVMEGSLPTNQDLQQLGILDQWDIDETQSKASEYINDWKDFLTFGGLLESLDFSSTIDALTEVDKTAYALEALGGADNVNKAIAWIGQRLKTWWDKLNGLNTEAGSNSSVTPNQPSNQVSQATSGAAKGATSSITEVVTKFTSIGQEEVEGSIDTIQTKAEQGADLKVKAVQDNSLNVAQNAINQLKSTTSSGVTLKTNTSGIDNAAKAPVSKPVDILDKATPKIKNIDAAAKKPVSKTINISPHYTGTWQHSVYLSATGPGAKATGQNNKISYIHVPQAGSAARGYGRLGPKGKGGMTLTGELGYEIAWLPSENRSMILGAHGPQMVNLPANAVVWTHEQSKKIMKQKSIPAGSHAYVEANGYKVKYPKTSVSGGTDFSGSDSSKKSGSKSKKKSSKKSKGSSDSIINNWSIEEVVRFDIDRKLETLASKIKKATDEIDKKLGRIGTKASHISAQTQAQVKNLQAVKANNEAIAASYQRDLNKLDTGGYNAKISYETGGSGKKKKNKTTEETINLSNYIYRDANGDYQIDKNAIANAGSKAKQEAIYKALEGALNPLVSGLQKAKDAAADAQKQMDELGKKISETFYQWENEITEVYDLTQRISHEESLRGRFSSQVALQLSKLNAGFGTAAQSIGLMQKALERDNKVLLEQIENQQKMIGARQRELKEALSAQDELDNLNRLRNKAYASAAAKTETINWATDQYTAARLGRNYLSNVRQDMDGSLRYEIDWARFNRDQKNDPYNKETYEAIKKYLDDLSSATDEFNNAIKDQTDLIKETYDALKEYQDYVGDYEDTLLKGLEEEIQNEVDNSKKLSDSITNALKDLLDEVKRKLDERRKQEDNRKTEDDIAKKQQRLAALRADTSGGNAVEIAQLEKEIAESQQSYQRTLEDQLLDKLQQQGDEAAKQRERLIDLTEKQLEVSSSNNTALVDMWLRDPETYKEQIKNAWLEAQGYSEKGEAGQYILQQEFESGFANLVTAINQSGFASGFESISGDTSTLVGLLEMLTEGRDKLTDSLSKAAGALQDVEKRDTESFELGKRTQKTAAQWKAEGLGAGDLKKWGYTFKELKDSGFTNAELKNAGFGISDFQANGISSVADLRGAGFKALDLKNANYKLTKELYNSSTWEDLKAAKFSVQDYVNIGVKDAASLRKAGITLNQLKSNATAWNSNSWAAIRKAGYTAADYKSAGLSYANAIASGFTDQQLYSYYTEAKTKIDNANKAAANKTAYNNAITAAHKAGTVTKATLKDAIAKGAAYGVSKNAYQVASDLANGDGDGGVTWKEVMAQLKALGYSGKTVKGWNPNAASSSPFRKAFEKKYGKWSKFAKGGLASFTGPAWLDGTPSKPELVLDARDTKNFIMLKDVLSKAMDSSSGLSGFGNAAYEININVDHINSDYDVDKIAKRVKENIVKDSGYRNVTQVRKFR